jgi:hypothetical protein
MGRARGGRVAEGGRRVKKWSPKMSRLEAGATESELLRLVRCAI